jgi:hypothetical protein
VRERAEAVVFQFEEKIWVIERSSDEAKLRGIEAGWAHINLMLVGRAEDWAENSALSRESIPHTSSL